MLNLQVVLTPHFISPLTASGVATLLLNPWVISAFAAAFAASICWMGAISRLPLSKAYPYMAINFLLVAVLATVLFKESMDSYKLAGTLIIVLGVVVLSRSVA